MIEPGFSWIDVMNDQPQPGSLIPDTSASLLLRIRDPCDADSWSTFERIYGAVIRRYCKSWNLQPNDVDDIVQDVMKAVAESIRSFDYDPAKGQFRGWLGTVTGNKIKKFLGKKERHQHVSLCGNPGKLVSFVDPDDEWVAVYGEVILQEACQMVKLHFEDRTWQCFELTWLKRWPHNYVAERLGIPLGSVYVNKSRVLKRLEQTIRDLSESYIPELDQRSDSLQADSLYSQQHDSGSNSSDLQQTTEEQSIKPTDDNLS
jgi:RNA polymerase sigma-70 factor (ECF subfamily)